jgi:hypothetical protein
MMTQSYNPNEELREDAIHQVEEMMRNSSIVGPRAGFTTRWIKRHRRENVKMMRRQTVVFVIINTVISFSLLGVLGWIYFYGTNSFGGAVAKLVSQMSSFWVEIQVIFQVSGSVLKIVPDIIPDSWWITIISLIGMILFAWTSRIRKSFLETGNKI